MSTPAVRVPSAIVLATVWTLTAIYLVGFVDRGWIPHDEGALAQSAERVLAGELPHRDFAELYSGGLTYLHAAALKLFGHRLVSLRSVLFAATLAFVPAVFAIARRFLGPVAAGVVTLTAVAWGVPNYFASLPSWYTLFFATWSVLALFRHVEDGRSGWLVVAGLCVGASCAIKVVGMYGLVAVSLFLVFRAQVLAAEDVTAPPAPTWWSGVVAAGAASVPLALLALVRHRVTTMDLLEFVLPGTVVSLVVASAALRRGPLAAPPRPRQLVALLAPFLVGVALPIAALLVPYAAAGAIGDLWQGVFVTPQRRLAFASSPLPPPPVLVALLPYALLLLSGRRAHPYRSTVIAAVAGGALALLLSCDAATRYTIVWYSAQSLTPLVVLVGAWQLRDPALRLTPRYRQYLFLVLAALAFGNLVRFPYSFTGYFVYVAPLVILAVVAVFATQPAAPRAAHGVALAGYLGFAVFCLHAGYMPSVGQRFARYDASAQLDLERGGLRVPPQDAREYRDIVDTVTRHRGDRCIFAAPDAPEIYFLTGACNPTRALFDFLAGPADLALVSRLLADDVRVVVVNQRPGFSAPLADDVQVALARAYPEAEEHGRFTVRWRP